MVNADVQSSLMLFDKTIKTDYGTTCGRRRRKSRGRPRLGRRSRRMDGRRSFRRWRSERERRRYGAANTLAGTATRALRMPRINKNASDKRAIVDATGFPPSFTSTSRAEFHSEASAAARAYVRQRPCYDRVSSCKTNYTLGKEPLVTRTTNDDLLAHPRTRPRAVQSEIGGWKRADGSYAGVEINHRIGPGPGPPWTGSHRRRGRDDADPSAEPAATARPVLI